MFWWRMVATVEAVHKGYCDSVVADLVEPVGGDSVRALVYGPVAREAICQAESSGASLIVEGTIRKGAFLVCEVQVI